MKLLLYANISWRLISKLTTHYEDCFHADHIGLNIPARDSEIWTFAAADDLIIVTNDDDFLNMVNLKGFPPKVILLRTGNQSNANVENIMVKHKSTIRDFYISTTDGILEIF